MVELIKPQENVRELATAPRRIPIEVDGAVSYEVILTIWSVFNSKEDGTTFDLGSDWFQRVVDSTPKDLADEIRTLAAPHCMVWLSILGLVSVAPHPHDPKSAFNWIGNLNPQRLRRWILGYIGEQAALHRGGESPSLATIEAAANGDSEAARQIVATDDEEEANQILTLFDIEATEFRDRVAGVLHRFHEEVFIEFEEEFGAAIAGAAAARRSVANRDDAKAVIEQVTNGLNYEVPIGVSRVILVPSVVIRPLSLIDRHREVLIVFYGLADEFLNTNPEAPPSWMVRFYKALSDERRLRILRRLSEGDTSLDELTALLGLSKSTVHHHISILRGAGLIRVHMGKGESKCYGLRSQAIEDAGEFLESYMRPPEKSALA